MPFDLCSQDEAFAGATKIDTQSGSVTDGERSYNFTIGDPDLVGGINRIRITVCTPSPTNCGAPLNVWRA